MSHDLISAYNYCESQEHATNVCDARAPVQGRDRISRELSQLMWYPLQLCNVYINDTKGDLAVCVCMRACYL